MSAIRSTGGVSLLRCPWKRDIRTLGSAAQRLHFPSQKVSSAPRAARARVRLEVLHAMKVSEWLRQYQISGQIPEGPVDDSMLPFWCGWLIGANRRIDTVTNENAIATAIRVAEFIESRAKG